MFFQYLKFNKKTVSKKLLSASVIFAVVLLNLTPLYYVKAQEITEETPTEEIIEEAPEAPTEEIVEETVVPEEETEENTEETAEEETVVINTGDSIAQTDIENGVNINETSLGLEEDIATTTDEVLEENASSTEETLIEETTESEEENASTTLDVSLDVENANDALVENSATTTAETGENEIKNADNSQINTGNAIATSNVVNVINVNITDSSGLFLLLNNFFNFSGNLDLRAGWLGNDSVSSKDLLCPEDTCSGKIGELETTVSNDNQSVIKNDIVVRSSTGKNTIEGGEDSQINTGDSIAASNLINVANTNIVNSNYFMLLFNNFGVVNGDLILPSSSFFASFFNTEEAPETPEENSQEDSQNEANGEESDKSVDIEIDNENDALVANTATTTSSTGDNTIEGGENSQINTGHSIAETSVVNYVNNNLFGGGSFSFIIRVYGSWSGNIYNLPTQISANRNGGNIELLGNTNSTNTQNKDTGNSSGKESTSITNKNNTLIENNVEVTSLTGENTIKNGGNSNINTGNSIATSNIVNVGGTNVFGKNWVTAIINIFGDWNGNISFGQPDLWIGTVASAHDNLAPGSNLDYIFTVSNKGDSDAHNVRIRTSLDEPFVEFAEGRFNDDSREYEWNIGDIRSGETKEFSFGATVSPAVPSGQTPISANIEVIADEPDANTEDNKDFLTVFAYNTKGLVDASMIPSPWPNLEITKTSNATSTMASSSVDYKISIINKSNIAHGSVLIDVLKNEAGEVISEQRWNLDDIYGMEEIDVTYTTEFGSKMTPGTYTNFAQIVAENGVSNIASSTILILSSNEGEVLGALIEEELEEAEVKIWSEPEVNRMPEIKFSMMESEPARRITLKDLFASLFKKVFDGEDNNDKKTGVLFAAVLYMSLGDKKNRKGKSLMLF